ncbi:MAG: Essential protein Yae1, N terminal [Sclerophora amabilis]|nr:MAG: Essential protein Yae1, N terminal [Sclerophora amabilis]
MDDDDDDEEVFFSSSRPPSPQNHHHQQQQQLATKKERDGFSEPSDVPRLRSHHSTVGYREGISVAKATAVQDGFDEGYALGAVIGLRVGYILGALDGMYVALVAATASAGGGGGGDSAVAGAGKEGAGNTEVERVKSLVRRARAELDTHKVFGTEFLAEEDAVWKWDVTDKAGNSLGNSEDFTFEEVADSHPLVRKWMEIVRGETARFGWDLHVLERTFGGKGSSGSSHR